MTVQLVLDSKKEMSRFQTGHICFKKTDRQTNKQTKIKTKHNRRKQKQKNNSKNWLRQPFAVCDKQCSL